ncbi:unnamed protein product, partial [Amoebophrya sp. A120]
GDRRINSALHNNPHGAQPAAAPGAIKSPPLPYHQLPKATISYGFWRVRQSMRRYLQWVQRSLTNGFSEFTRILQNQKTQKHYYGNSQFVKEISNYLNAPSSIVRKCYGKVLVGSNGNSVLVHPEWRTFLYSNVD